MIELEHTTTVQSSITSENRHKRCVAPWFIEAPQK